MCTWVNVKTNDVAPLVECGFGFGRRIDHFLFHIRPTGAPTLLTLFVSSSPMNRKELSLAINPGGVTYLINLMNNKQHDSPDTVQNALQIFTYLPVIKIL